MGQFKKRLSCAIFSIFILSSIVACNKESMKTAVSLTAYNHTENGVGSYIVTLDDGSSVEVGYLAPGEGGGGETCCISIPATWKPGVNATIAMHILKNGKPLRVEKTVSIPSYNSSETGRFVVHFLHDGSLKVFVTKYSLGHRKYPLAGKEAELEPGVPLEIIWE